jgi:hemerythrin-like domain-containing protein
MINCCLVQSFYLATHIVSSVSENKTKMADSRDMVGVHDAFRLHFGALALLVREVEPGDVARAKVVSDHALLLADLVTAHHAGEDEHVWPMLHERTPMEVQRLVDTMEAQHEEIHAGLDKLVAGCRRWASSADAAQRDALAGTAEWVDWTLREHLELEEAEVLRLIDSFLTQAEWQATIAAGAAGLTPAQGALVLGMVLASADEEMQELLRAGVSEEFWRDVRPAALAAWQAHATQVYGHSK